MEQTNMSQLVATLEQDRAAHIKKTEDLTFRQLKSMQKKNYVPRLRTKSELTRLVKVKNSWKGSGATNNYFIDPPIMRPKILDPWTASRV